MINAFKYQSEKVTDEILDIQNTSRYILLPAIQLGMPGNTPLGLAFVDSSFLF